MLDLGDVTAIVMNSNLLMRQRADAILRTTAAQWDKEQSTPIAASIPTKARSSLFKNNRQVVYPAFYE
jgi:hypothetical protein